MIDPTAGFETRLGREDDADAIAEVHVASWRSAYAGIVPADVLASLSVPQRATRFRSYLRGEVPGASTYVVVNENDIVGFATIGPARDEDAVNGTLEIYAIYLREDAWGSGAGRELLRNSLDGHDNDTILLWVLQDNDRAQRFYRRNGFEADGTERIHEMGGTPLTEVRYIRG